jgi:TATA-binding protein-associated factor
LFSFTKKRLEGILSFNAGGPDATSKENEQDPAKVEELRKARLSRRGARLAFREFSNMFGSNLFDVLPNIWPCTVGGLLSAFQCGKSLKLVLSTSV